VPSRKTCPPALGTLHEASYGRSILIPATKMNGAFWHVDRPGERWKSPSVLFNTTALLAQSVLYSFGIFLIFLRQRGPKSRHEVEQEIAALNLPTGVASLKAIREDPEVFEKAKQAARLRVKPQEPPPFDQVLSLAGLSEYETRRHFGIRLVFVFALIGLVAGLAAILHPPRSFTHFAGGINLGLLSAAIGSGIYIWHLARAARREIEATLPAFAQQMIAMLVAGYDVESGLKKILEVYRLRETRGFFVDLLSKVALRTQESGSLASTLRAEAAGTGIRDVRHLFACMERGAEQGASTVKALQDLAAVLSTAQAPGRLARYAHQPLSSFLAYAGIPLRPEMYRLTQGGLCLFGIACGLLLHFTPTGLVALSLTLPGLPYIAGLRRIASRAHAFERDFPFFIGQLTSLLCSGKETLVALKLAMGYLSEDSLLRTELESLCNALVEQQDEIKVLATFAKFIPSPAAEQMGLSLALSRMAPGKLYHMLTQAVTTIQKRT
jgi:Flp pilus assembly protein TadB